MTRRLGSGSLVIATHNAGKLKEISALLEPHGMKCLSAGSLGLPEPAETRDDYLWIVIFRQFIGFRFSIFLAPAENRIAAENQQAGFPLVGLGEISVGLAGGQLHAGICAA